MDLRDFIQMLLDSCNRSDVERVGQLPKSLLTKLCTPPDNGTWANDTQP